MRRVELIAVSVLSAAGIAAGTGLAGMPVRAEETDGILETEERSADDSNMENPSDTEEDTEEDPDWEEEDKENDTDQGDDSDKGNDSDKEDDTEEDDGSEAGKDSGRDDSTIKDKSAHFERINGKDYWYENGIRQGTSKDPKGVYLDGTNRGREIYDEKTNSWYWLDADADGAKAVNKQVVIPYIFQDDGGKNGSKWVRYDARGQMVTGWYTSRDGKVYYDETTGAMKKGLATVGKNADTYYFDPSTGVMQTGEEIIDGMPYYFNEKSTIQSVYMPDTGRWQTVTRNIGAGADNVWVRIGGRDYWYEKGKRQGYDPSNPLFRGKEIYDPGTRGWYWLDNVEQGARAVSKDVYQESNGGKWVRYDQNGSMIKGWSQKDGQDAYFDQTTGAMLKGNFTIDDVNYTFDGVTGVMASPYGNFTTGDHEAIVNRINEIRYEACSQGVYYNGRNLTLSDYKPVEWDDGLGAIADVRAVEATFRNGHTRPNGETCFSVKGNNEESNSENLAWNNEGVMEGLQQWYDEKPLYEQTLQWSGDTGHYLNLINPDHTRIGVSCFHSGAGRWYYTISYEGAGD